MKRSQTTVWLCLASALIGAAVVALAFPSGKSHYQRGYEAAMAEASREIEDCAMDMRATAEMYRGRGEGYVAEPLEAFAKRAQLIAIAAAGGTVDQDGVQQMLSSSTSD